MEKKTLITGSIIATSLLAGLSADAKPSFSADHLGTGGELRAQLLGDIVPSPLFDKIDDLKCGEGKCGDKKADAKSKDHKCGEGKCGDKKAEAKSKDHKCGEGKCGDKKAEAKSKDHKCGEGKCGDKKVESKSKDHKCGEGKCGDK